MLLDLVKKLQQEHRGQKHIKVRFSDEGLEFEYDPQRGLATYEQVKFIPSYADCYHLVYTALLTAAQETFSHPSEQERISSQPFLAGLKKEIEKASRDSREHEKEKLLELNEENIFEPDIIQILDFFSDTFRRKSQAYQT